MTGPYISVKTDDVASLSARYQSAQRQLRVLRERFGEALGFAGQPTDDELVSAASRAWRVAQGVAEGTLTEEVPGD